MFYGISVFYTYVPHIRCPSLSVYSTSECLSLHMVACVRVCIHLSSIYFYVLKRFARKHNDFSWLSSGDFQFWDFSYLFSSIVRSSRVQSPLVMYTYVPSTSVRCVGYGIVSPITATAAAGTQEHRTSNHFFSSATEKKIHGRLSAIWDD